MLIFILVVIAISLAGGIVSGLFGGGSGIIYVPGFFAVLSYAYPHQEHLMQTAISTCFASSILLGFIASLKQTKYGHVQFSILKIMLGYILLGAVVGVYLMTLISSDSLKTFFAIILLLIGLWMIKRLVFPAKVKNMTNTERRSLALISGFCTMLSGVSAFFVPFFIRYGLEIKNSIGISTIITFMLSLIMSVVTIIFGLHAANLPPHNLGYLNYGIFSIAIIPAVLGAMIGSKLTHVLPIILLQYIYILMVFIVAGIMTF